MVKSNKDEVIVASSALNEFTNYMNSRAFTFKFDHAIGFLRWFRQKLTPYLNKVLLKFDLMKYSKDLWDSDTTLPASTRAATTGISSYAGICTNKSYSIAEDFGSLQNIEVFKHSY